MEAVLQMYTMIGDLGIQPSRELIGLLSFDESMALSQLETGIEQLRKHVNNSGTVGSFFTECDQSGRPPVFARHASHILNGLDCHIDELGAMRILMRDSFEFADVCEHKLDTQPISNSEIVDLRMFDPQLSSTLRTGILGERRWSTTSIVSQQSTTSLNSCSSGKCRSEIKVNEPSAAIEIEANEPSDASEIKASEPSAAEANEPSAASEIKASEPSAADEIEANEPSAESDIEASDSGIKANEPRPARGIKANPMHNFDSESEDDKPIFVKKRVRSPDSESSDFKPKRTRRDNALARQLKITELLSGVDFGVYSPHVVLIAPFLNCSPHHPYRPSLLLFLPFHFSFVLDCLDDPMKPIDEPKLNQRKSPRTSDEHKRTAICAELNNKVN